MGILFVIIFHLIIIFILCIIIAVIAGLMTFFLCDKEKRIRKLIFSVISPFVGLYLIYFCGLFGSIVVSEIKNVDIGIGDSWYVPLPNNCELLFIDIPENAYIEKNGQTVISEVSQLQQIDNEIIGMTTTNKYFSYNTKTNALKEFLSKDELIIQNSNIKPKLINSVDFYTDIRDEIAGFWFILVGVLSVIISITVLYLLKRLIIKRRKIE